MEILRNLTNAIFLLYLERFSKVLEQVPKGLKEPNQIRYKSTQVRF